MNKYTVLFLIISLILAVAWVGTNIYHTRTEELPISPKLQEATEPLSPNFDTETLNKVKETVITGRDIVPQSAPVPIVTPAPIPTPSTTPIPIRPGTSPRPSTTPTASPR